MNRHAKLRAALATILALLAGGAAAHSGADGGAHHGLLAGLAHPFTGIDHLLAILAVGFWSASLNGRGRLAAMAFPAAMLAGALLAASGFAVPAIEPMIATSLLFVGLLIAAPARFVWSGAASSGAASSGAVAPGAAAPGAVAPGVVAAVVGVFAFFHGAAHGQELAGDAAALVGMLCGTALLLSVGAALALAARSHSAWWPRASGAAISLVGVALLVPMLSA